MVQQRKQLGRWGEATATRYLLERQYSIIIRNWRCAIGELDIVAYDRRADCLVFCEVRTRHPNRFVPLEAAINMVKLNKLEAVINEYRIITGHRGNYRCDIILIERGWSVRLLHLRNAPWQ